MIEKINESLLISISKYRDLLRQANPEFKGATNLIDYDDIDKWYANSKLFESKDTCPPGYTLSFQYAFIEDNEVVGLINIRPEAHLFPSLMNYVGHIGYSIRPDYRNRGLGEKMLKAFLPVIRKDFGLDKVLITCDENNIASKKVILANGGILENTLYCSYDDCNIERYWIKLVK